MVLLIIISPQNYKAYAYTRADGSIADYFFEDMFGASNSGKIRDISGQPLAVMTRINQNFACINGQVNRYTVSFWLW